MTETYMLTLPREVGKKAIKVMIEANDCKKWIVAKETGKNGYEHYQIRLQTSNDQFFHWVKDHMPKAHVEACTDTWEYERKEGQYWTSQDTALIRQSRFGKPNKQQENFLKMLKTQSDRQIDVIYDEKGGWGKSWLTRHLWETKQCYYVPPTVSSVQGLIQWVASGYDGEPIIIIDIPRSWKWSEPLYTAIESIKDGMVYDTRYSAKMRDIWGVKVVCMTNAMPKVDKLSADRWRISVVG